MLAAALAFAVVANARAANARVLITDDEPPLPVERGAGPADDAVRVALVDSGVDYTLPLIRDALARTADGHSLGIDFRDGDNRPFDAVAGPGARVRRHGTRVASVLLAEAPDVALVPYRYPGQDMRLMHALVEHAAAIGVRVVGLPLGSDDPAQWQAFAAAARRHPELLFVGSAGNDGRDLDKHPLYPASLALDNLVTVSSADDFGRASPESGTGRGAVDWLIPAEAVTVTGFGGERSIAAGASYAVPKLVARYAREFSRTPHASVEAVIARVRAEHANGLQPAAVADGVMIDPLADTVGPIEHVLLPGAAMLQVGASNAARRVIDALARARDVSMDPLVVPLDVLVLDSAWTIPTIVRTVAEAAAILAQCGIELVPAQVELAALDAADRLRDLHVGSAHTLFERLGRNGTQRAALAVFARDTRMQVPFEAEAFGLGNTRYRSWLAHSVWLSTALASMDADAGIALAHELWHVLANSGEHTDDAGNLMTARTSGNNRVLDDTQCAIARDGALWQRLAVTR